MKIKKHLYNVFFLMLLGGIGFISGMDYPGMEQGELRPVDRVFLNAAKNNKNITLALNHGAHLYAVDPENGYSALHYAAMNGNIPLITFLFSKGLEDFPAADGLESSGVARQFGHPEAAQYILDAQLIGLCFFDTRPKKDTISRQLFFEQAAQLLKKGANINAVKRSKDPFDGFTPLLFACMQFDVEKIKFWIEKGADVNQASTFSMTPIYTIFVRKNNVLGALNRYPIVQLLLDNGADITIKGPENHNVLQQAIVSEDVELIRFLLRLMQSKMDLNIPDDQGQNALSDAVAYNRIDLLDLLYDSGILLRSNIHGVSPLHAAAIKNFLPIVEWLIGKGVEMNAVDKDGQTPLHYAAEHASLEVVNALLKAGADPRIKDKSGKTAALLSHKNKHSGVNALLKKVKKPLIVPKAAQAKQAISVEQVKEENVKKPAVASLSKSDTKNKKTKNKKKKKPASQSIEAMSAKPQADEQASEQLLLQQQFELEEAPAAPRSSQPQPIASDEKPKKSKPSLSGYVEQKKQAASDYVQKKVEATLAPTKATIISGARSYAGAVDPSRSENKQQNPVEKITIPDDNMVITAPILPSQQLMLTTGNQDNPLIRLRYSEHVQKKKSNPKDDAHNFSSQVEEKLGHLAQSKVIKQGKKDHPPVIQYTIPATIGVFGGPRISGAFEFMSEGNIMTHRMFKADKKIKKQKVDKKDLPLLMPPKSSGDSKELP